MREAGPISGLPEIGILKRKSGKPDLRVSVCLSQWQAGAARGTARRDYARLPGAWLTERCSVEFAPTKSAARVR
jgi:hypothetical protein